MPWYKLPHADMVMWFEREMDLEPATAYATSGVVVQGPTSVDLQRVIDEVVIPSVPESEEEAEAT